MSFFSKIKQNAGKIALATGMAGLGGFGWNASTELGKRSVADNHTVQRSAQEIEGTRISAETYMAYMAKRKGNESYDEFVERVKTDAGRIAEGRQEKLQESKHLPSTDELLRDSAAVGKRIDRLLEEMNELIAERNAEQPPQETAAPLETTVEAAPVEPEQATPHLGSLAAINAGQACIDTSASLPLAVPMPGTTNFFTIAQSPVSAPPVEETQPEEPSLQKEPSLEGASPAAIPVSKPAEDKKTPISPMVQPEIKKNEKKPVAANFYQPGNQTGTGHTILNLDNKERAAVMEAAEAANTGPTGLTLINWQGRERTQAQAEEKAAIQRQESASHRNAVGGSQLNLSGRERTEKDTLEQPSFKRWLKNSFSRDGITTLGLNRA